MFGRRTQEAPEDPPQVVKPGGKGRPTPKRSEAQKKRLQPITAPPSDRKEAYKRLREKQAAERARAREGMARGEEKFLLKRDKGPVRRLARDYVDSRRTIGSYLMYVLFAIIVLSLLPIPAARLFGLLAPPVLLVAVFIEGFVLSTGVKRIAAAKYPDESTKGIGMYAALRAMQIRRLRQPPPQVKLGERPTA
ncbi:DUF3043 domain-containing protein [Actinomadura atramentaria]|uniref:DUF3043 domain-containing protein n=1 Tax=Actinomadura atramentaria TaxID=1990 RepID=UPI0003A83485|nr:DUF3043 domain-containing protein [Actinomadura atramentaria]